MVWLLVMVVGALGAAPPEVVTVPLKDYQSMYREAYFNQMTQELQKEAARCDAVVQKLKDAHDATLKRQREGRASSKVDELTQMFPENWLLLNHSAVGVCDVAVVPEEGRMATFDVMLLLRVFSDHWTEIPLVESSAIVSDWSVHRVVGSAVMGAEESSEEAVALTGQTVLVMRETHQALATNVSGVYRITYRLHGRVRTTRNLHTLSLNLMYPISETRLRLLSVEGGAIGELNVQPAAHYYLERQEGGNGTATSTDIVMILVPSRTIDIKWRALDATTEKKAKKAQATPTKTDAKDKVASPDDLQATVTHDALHSIGEGLLQTSHVFTYSVDVDAVTLTSLVIMLEGQSRVTAVSGLEIKRWTALSTGKSNATELRVVFKNSLISSKVLVTVNTEQAIDTGSEGTLTLPVVLCRGVLRQTGTMGIVKVANVEVYEHAAAGVARADPSEVSSQLRYQTTRPIVLAYKYLSSQHSVILSMLHHEDVDVLEAVVDTFYHQALVVDTHIMHRVLLNMQNTKQQYMALNDLPPKSNIWSVFVNNVACKPVRGRDGLLLPLLTGTTNNDGSSQRTSIELAYLTPHTALGDTGALTLSPPTLGVPISILLMEVSVNEKYTTNFTVSGGLTQVSTFHHRLPIIVDYTKGKDVVKEEHDFSTVLEDSDVNTKASVRFKVPKAGRVTKFEQLMVMGGAPSLKVAYKPHTKVTTKSGPKAVPWWKTFFGGSEN